MKIYSNNIIKTTLILYFMSKYLIRFDDINSRIDWDRFLKIKKTWKVSNKIF